MVFIAPAKAKADSAASKAKAPAAASDATKSAPAAQKKAAEMPASEA